MHGFILLVLLFCNADFLEAYMSNQQLCTYTEKTISAGSSQGDWIVVKATVMSQPPPGFNLGISFCSPFCYVPGVCGGIRLLINDNDDGTMIMNTYAIDRLTNIFVHFEQKVKQLKSNYELYQAKDVAMETLNTSQGHEFDDVIPIPEVITNSQGVPFSKISHNVDGKWMIFSTCDANQYTWVMVQRNVILKNQLSTYKTEYEQVLQTLGVNMNRMVDLPIAEKDYSVN